MNFQCTNIAYNFNGIMDADRFDSHHLLDTGPTSAMLDIAKNCSVYSYPNIHTNSARINVNSTLIYRLHSSQFQFSTPVNESLMISFDYCNNSTS